MSPAPPPIGEPESLGELSRLMSYALAAINQSITDLTGRFDQLVTREQHRADLAALRRDVDNATAEAAAARAACEAAQARSAAINRWAIGSMITVVSIVVTIWLTLSGR